MATKTKSLRDYPVFFFEAWDLACAGRLSVSFEEKGLATSFRHRMYSFRRRFIEEGAAPEKVPQMGRASLKIREDKETGKWFVENIGMEDWQMQVSRAYEELGNRENLNGQVQVQEQVQEQESQAQDQVDTSPAPADPLESTLQNLGFGTKEIKGKG